MFRQWGLELDGCGDTDGEHYEDLGHKIMWIILCTLSLFALHFQLHKK